MANIKYFTLGEFLNSPTAKRLGIDNTPTFAVAENLIRLGQYLDKVREKMGVPITVTSGYRSTALNKAVGGVVNSQHTKGLAADLVCYDKIGLVNCIKEIGGFDQLITEHKKGSKDYWVHVSVPTKYGKARQQVILNLEKK